MGLGSTPDTGERTGGKDGEDGKDGKDGKDGGVEGAGQGRGRTGGESTSVHRGNSGGAEGGRGGESRTVPVSERDTKPVNWEEFTARPLDPVLSRPVPSFYLVLSRDVPVNEGEETVLRFPDRDELSALLALPANRQRIKECRLFHRQVDIAAKFQKWAAEKPIGKSVLLTAEPRVCYWFVGDVHGDLESLARIYAYIKQESECDAEHDRHVLILLGDLIDRGEEDFAVLAFVQQLLMEQDEHASRLTLMVMRGNHDCALRYDEGKAAFLSSVDPAETAERLNGLIAEGYERQAQTLGAAVVELGRICPCMGELTHVLSECPSATILFTHGGVPHTDLQKAALSRCEAGCVAEDAPLIESLPGDMQEGWMSDFTWIRLVERGPRKIPNRSSHGCQMGVQDVNNYRRLHYRLTHRAITFIIRGHDHEEGGFKLYSYDPAFNPARGTSEFNCLQENCGVLTINAMMRDRAVTGEAVAARWCKGEAISLFRFPFDR